MKMRKNTVKSTSKKLVVSNHDFFGKHNKSEVDYNSISGIVNKILKPGETKTAIKPNELETLESMALAPTFSEMVVSYMDCKRMKNVDVYKAAGIDRRLFSKILSNRNHQPSKETVIQLCMALHLSLDEAEKLMSTAGFAFSHSKLSNVVVEYFLMDKNYNLDDLYEVFDSLGIYDEL